MKLARPMAVLFIACGAMSIPSGRAIPQSGPTAESALEAEKELGQTMRTNDADGFCRLLDPDWAIVTGNGDVGEGDTMGDGKTKNDVCGAIKSGNFTRETYVEDLAHARVRVYGNIATVTFSLSASGAPHNHYWAAKEVQTDVLKWEDGAWKAVLTHETIVKGSLRTTRN
jgi:hypothetical protein